jgi:hypothetical protein
MLALVTSSTSLAYNEIKTYFQEPIVAANTDVLSYWKENSIRFPILSEMAKDYLSMMPTSAASDRAFSLGGLTKNNSRTNLNPNPANESLCLFSWFKTFIDKFKKRT